MQVSCRSTIQIGQIKEEKVEGWGQISYSWVAELNEAERGPHPSWEKV